MEGEEKSLGAMQPPAEEDTEMVSSSEADLVSLEEEDAVSEIVASDANITEDTGSPDGSQPETQDDAPGDIVSAEQHEGTGGGESTSEAVLPQEESVPSGDAEEESSSGSNGITITRTESTITFTFD